MFRRLVTTYLLLVMTAVSTGGVALRTSTAPMVRIADGRSLPAAPTAPVHSNLPGSAPLSTSQMSADRGDGIWGWLKKIWNKNKKKIFKIIWQIIKEVIDSIVTSETTEAVEGINGTVAETYEGTDATEQVYASQADYDANNIQSSSYSEGAYSYSYTDYSAGSYEY